MSKGLKNKGKKCNSAVQDCPLQKGAICVVVTDLWTKKGVNDVEVSIEGKTPGNKATDSNGLALFEQCDPGAYQLAAVFPAKYKHYYSENRNAFETPFLTDESIVAETTRFWEIKVYPTGDLKVEVFYKDAEGKETPIDNSVLSNIKEIYTDPLTCPESISKTGLKSNSHLFKGVKSGKYQKIYAKLDENSYIPELASSEVETQVGPGQEGYAKIVVELKTWIKIWVYDVEEKKNLEKFSVKLKKLGGEQVKLLTKSTGQVEEKMKHIAGICSLDELESNTETVYEVVSVEEIG